jgi:hypothetical protein
MVESQTLVTSVKMKQVKQSAVYCIGTYLYCIRVVNVVNQGT